MADVMPADVMHADVMPAPQAGDPPPVQGAREEAGSSTRPSAPPGSSESSSSEPQSGQMSPNSVLGDDSPAPSPRAARGSGRAAVAMVRASRPPPAAHHPKSPYEMEIRPPAYALLGPRSEADREMQRLYSARNQDYIRKLTLARHEEKAAVAKIARKQGKLRERLRSSVLAARSSAEAGSDDGGAGEGGDQGAGEETAQGSSAPAPAGPPGKKLGDGADRGGKAAELMARYGSGTARFVRRAATQPAPRRAPGGGAGRPASARATGRGAGGWPTMDAAGLDLPAGRLSLPEGVKGGAGGKGAGEAEGGEAGRGRGKGMAKRRKGPHPSRPRPSTVSGAAALAVEPSPRKKADLSRSPYSMAVQGGRARGDSDYTAWRQRQKVPPGARVFCTTGAGVDDIREGLLRRGWWENKDGGSDFFDFKWALKANEVTSEQIKAKLRAGQLVNHFGNASQCITTKLGLVKSLRDLKWHQVDEHSFYPRSHVLGSADDKEAFAVDFKWTAAEGVLKRAREDGGLTPLGVSAVSQLLLALRVCTHRLKHERHLVDEDYKSFVRPLPELKGAQWATLLRAPLFRTGDDLADLVRARDAAAGGEGGAAGSAPRPLAAGTLAEIDRVLGELRGRHVQVPMDGAANVWILKPGGKSRGRGIKCMNNLDRINEYTASEETSYGCTEQWVAQKYIERPLVICRRKFDIRQWVLVTSWRPLTIWFYRDCYLRFCAEDYDLLDVENGYKHLSNNSIAKYSENFDAGMVGEGNMWHSNEFVSWLEEQGGGAAVWEQKLQPRMKEIATASLLAAQDTIEPRANSIELYGYDYVVDESYNTWLLEVNCSPCLSHSTPVTGKLVSAMMEDLLKVVVDHPDAAAAQKCALASCPAPDNGAVPPPDLTNVRALPEEYTGRWELIHLGINPAGKARSSFPTADLVVKGAGLAQQRRKEEERIKPPNVFEPPMSMVKMIAEMKNKVAKGSSARRAGKKGGKKGRRRRSLAGGVGEDMPVTEDNALASARWGGGIGGGSAGAGAVAGVELECVGTSAGAEGEEGVGVGGEEEGEGGEDGEGEEDEEGGGDDVDDDGEGEEDEKGGGDDVDVDGEGEEDEKGGGDDVDVDGEGEEDEEGGGDDVDVDGEGNYA